VRSAKRSERAAAPRRSLLAALACLPLGLLGCAGGGLGSGGSSSSGATHPLIGAPAPEFELAEATGGAKQSLAAHSGKLLIVDFWATWCEPCKQSFPAYQKLVERMAGGLVVIGVSQDDDPQAIPGFRAETGAKFPLVWDDDKLVAKSYDPPTMPTAFVIDRSGIVRFVHVGYRAGDEDELEQELRSLAK
jgi:peroxiredoxin